MAEVLVSFVAEPLFSIFLEDFISRARKEIRLCAYVPKDLQKLEETFEAIRTKLADAEKRQVKGDSVKDLLEKLKNVAYDAEDILDEWNTEALRSEIRQSIAPATNRLQVSNFCSPCLSFDQIAFRCKVGHGIKEIRERLEEISQEMRQFNFDVYTGGGVRGDESTLVKEKRATGSMVDKSGVFGRDDDTNRLTDLLLNESSNPEEKLSIISVVGMGGLGKTTLAQLPFDDESVKNRFKIRMWVYVSNTFLPTELMSAMIQSATKKNCNLTQLSPLQVCLRKILKGKLFLLVLDDVWIVDGEQWDRLMSPLTVGAQGSRIVVTTRKKKVAKIMGTTHILDLPTLSDHHCWSLFSHWALKRQSRDQGLPLAVKAIGRVIEPNNKKQDWVKIKESEIWTNDILPVLMLSYQELPLYLKQCFLYLTIFPKDYEIEKEKLIYMWIAQGYVLPKNGEVMEEVGGSYFDELLWRSLLQDSKIDDEGNIVTYKMHSLISDLAQSISGTECPIIDIAKMPIEASIKTCHSSIISTRNVESIPEAFCKNANHLRTITMCIKEHVIVKASQDLLNKFIRLRVLDLSRSGLEEVSYSIENLIHLRYLDLSYTNIVKLPDSIGSMCNMMFLILIGCHELHKLPEKMGKMNSLRCLLMDSDKSNFLPNEIGRIKSLVRLTFVVGDGQSKIGELKNLNLLQNLSIRCLERVVTSNDAKEAALMEKRDLHTLQLLWSVDLEKSEMGRQVNVLEGLQPHTNLTRLTIENYSGHEFPSWIGDEGFSTLTNVSLKECNECEILPALGKLPSLKFLSFRGMKNVKCVGHEFYGSGGVNGFPKLEKLTIVPFENLVSCDLRVEEGEMPSLLHLEIIDCPKLTSLPQLWQVPSLKFLSLQGIKNVKYVGCEFCGSGGVKGFPKLEKLTIVAFEKLEEWDLRVEEGEMPSLLDLEIYSCPKLKSLPYLPSNLKRLIIKECPPLKERYQEGRDDWNKIAHIQYKRID